MRSAMFLSCLVCLSVVIISEALPQKLSPDDVTVDPSISGPNSGPGIDLPEPPNNRVRPPFGVRDFPNDPSLPRFGGPLSVDRSRPSAGSDSLSGDRPRPSSGPDSSGADKIGRFGRPIDNIDGSDVVGGADNSGINREGTGTVRQNRPKTEVGGPGESRPRRQAGAPGQSTPLGERTNPDTRISTNVRPESDRNPTINVNGRLARKPESLGSVSPNLNQKPPTGKPALSSLSCMVRDGSNVETRKKSCTPESSCSIGPLSIQLNGSNVNVFFCRVDEHALMSLACRLEGVPINALRLHQCAAGDVCSVGPLVIDLPFGQTRIQSFFCNNETVEQPRLNVNI